MFQLPRQYNFGFSAFQRFRGPGFCPPFSVSLLDKILHSINIDKLIGRGTVISTDPRSPAPFTSPFPLVHLLPLVKLNFVNIWKLKKSIRTIVIVVTEVTVLTKKTFFFTKNFFLPTKNFFLTKKNFFHTKKIPQKTFSQTNFFH